MKESASIRFLYNNFFGRLLLKLFKRRWLSRICGSFLNSRLSKPLIKKFIKNNNIDMSEYHSDDFSCFNDCFCRRIKEECRPINQSPEALIAPCDGLLSVHPIKDGTILPIKQSIYSVESLLRNTKLAETYSNGVCLVFRLCVDNYHRYHYLDDAIKGENIFIPGFLHTVRPTALEALPVFIENCREYTVMETANFGKVTQIEVGALLVGKIKNYHGTCNVKRGEEKGRFLYGGSTVILLFERDRISLENKYVDTVDEIPVKMGERIGYKKSV